MLCLLCLLRQLDGSLRLAGRHNLLVREVAQKLSSQRSTLDSSSPFFDFFTGRKSSSLTYVFTRSFLTLVSPCDMITLSQDAANMHDLSRFLPVLLMIIFGRFKGVSSSPFCRLQLLCTPQLFSSTGDTGLQGGHIGH